MSDLATRTITGLSLPTVSGLAEYRGQADEILLWAKSVTITDSESLSIAVAKLGDIAKANREAETRRKSLTEAPNHWVKSVNETIKWVVAPLAEAESIVKRAVAVWQDAERRRVEDERRRIEVEQRRIQEEARQARLAEDAAKREAEARAKATAEAATLPEFYERMVEQEDAERHAEKAAESVKIVEAASVPVLMPAAPERTMVSGGTAATVRQVWTFELTNLADVPRVFLRLNETKVREAIGAGVREIPGLRIFPEAVVAVRTR